MKVVGVDGCRGGWVAAAFAEGDRPLLAVFPNIAALMAAHGDAHRVLIDIPIGLPESAPRVCDRLARMLLGARAPSVFPVPTRRAVYARSYAQACAINERMLGRRISRQTWNLCPKIREVDTWLRSAGMPPSALRESHPEIGFWALAGGRPMRYSKKTPEGHGERLRLLCRAVPGVERVLSDLPRGVRPDDALDALALGVTARPNRLTTLPPNPPSDAQGLPMEIVHGPVHW